MSHSLLLRLFQNYFSLHVALQYLSLYSDNIGITYYITRRLRQFDTQELADVWGFICHLLVTRPSKSRALECFVTDICSRSTHIALLTLWFMQASLRDLALVPHGSHSFVICQRILLRCHEIIFGDLPPPATGPYASISLPFQSRFQRKKIKHHAEPAIVGIGVVLASVPGMPCLTDIVGQVAIEQGRIDEDGTDQRSIDRHEENSVRTTSPTISTLSIDDDEDEDEDEPEPAANKPRARLARRRTIGASLTAPALPLHLKKSRASIDPLGQLDNEQVMTPYQSTPSMHPLRTPIRSSSVVNTADALLHAYDDASQTHLLRSHYCRSEVQFLLTLENISNRLLVIPRPARISALRAELTALNHILPAEVCMPMWCSSSDATLPGSGQLQPHHRIVRIPPGESVVLNSAERAPYVLLIEILNDDLDFDPARRANKEVLKKIVLKEQERKGASKDLIPFNTIAVPHRHKKTLSGAEGLDVGVDPDAPVAAEPADSPISATVSVIPATPTTSGAQLPSEEEEEEEVDLVEQLYGQDTSLRTRADLSDTIVLPPTPKNKELDMAAWSRPSSIPPSPLFEQNPIPEPPLTPGHALSLDEYSERMRTAAIMLAQLNASTAQQQHAQNGANENHSTWASMSWLPGSNWLSVTGPNQSTEQQTQTQTQARQRVEPSDASGIKDRIMAEMLALEEERMERMKENRDAEQMAASIMRVDNISGMKTAEDEGIIRRELNKADPSAVVFSESWAAKKSRIRHGSPYGHLANWDCVSVIVKTGGDLRQEQLATQLIREFQRIWTEENCQCWARYFRIVILGGSSGLVETITDAVSIHSIKKAEYARRITEGRLGHVTLLDHFIHTYGDPSSAKFIRAQRNFAKSLAGYSVIAYLLQIKDRHNGNILLDRDGHLIHIDFGFILTNTPGNIGFEAAPFKFPYEYIEVLGGVTSPAYHEFRRLFREGFEAARKHCDRIITLIELMQKDSSFPCFAAFGEQTAAMVRERFQPALTHSLVGEHVDRLIDTSLGSHWTRLYDSFQYYSQSIL
ncbi:hypothetical protein CYLTODRAFT_370254 [Cylindrobasidium torrendii FP15055 ss-10]|uniref:1-phosphatidylinositol 4-kinase n=1 Tax=Cylindrobasidium torrendii FP15055 ss-10 TaxID=1314674 RepID=A0A0D7BK62_9AGAR|nr:hypothetical protein CYLTODRAFT_370254 [Cylindrobasidium torrendii FP15055 ss-10]